VLKKREKEAAFSIAKIEKKRRSSSACVKMYEERTSRDSVFHSKSACPEITCSAPAGDYSESLFSCGRSGPRARAQMEMPETLSPDVDVNLAWIVRKLVRTKAKTTHAYTVSIAATRVLISRPSATKAPIAKSVNPGITSQIQLLYNRINLSEVEMRSEILTLKIRTVLI
jgi:hypothetical protein